MSVSSAKLLLSILAFAIGTGAVAADLEGAEDWRRQIDELARGELDRSGLPSLQVAVGRGTRIIFEAAYGMADVENGVLATTRTKYRTASVPKWFAASIAMGLAEQSRLDLDKPVQSYCPQFPEKKWPITTRQVLTHTAGIRDYSFHRVALGRATTEDERKRLELLYLRDQLGTYTRYTDVISPLKNFQDDALLFEPGSNWSYSSHGYRVLACVLQGVTGMSYSKLLEEQVFLPLQMLDTVPDDALAIIPHRAAGYTLLPRKILQRAELRDVSENLGAGGHLSTASDLAKFALAFDGGRFVGPESKVVMMTPSVKTQSKISSPLDAAPSREKYGYGMMLFPDDSGMRVGHSGRIAGATALVTLNPQTHVVVATLTNAKGWNGSIALVGAIESIVEKNAVRRDVNPVR